MFRYDSFGLGSVTFDANGPKMYYYAYDDENRMIAAYTDTYYTPEAAYDCAKRVTEWVLRNYGPGGAKRAPDDQSCREAHCIVNCEISRQCSGGRFTALLASWYKETCSSTQKYDPVLWCPLSWISRWDAYDFPLDMKANKKGRQVSKQKGPTCEALCRGTR